MRRIRFKIPQAALIAVAAVAGAVWVWPSDLSWGLVVVAFVAAASLCSFEFWYGEEP